MKPLVFKLSNLLLLVFGLGACRADDQASELDWGHISYNQSANKWLINIKPTDKVKVCAGDRTDLVKDAIRKWAEPLGRDKQFPLVNCDDAGSAKLTVDVTFNSTQDSCRQNGVLGWAMPGTGITHICKSAMNSQKFLWGTLFHEIGHHWGMCDQYSNGAGCDRNNSGQVNNNTVMGNSMSSSLTNDDITGINAMMNRSEFSASKMAWDEFLKNAPTDSDSNNPGDPNMPDNQNENPNDNSTTPGDGGIAIASDIFLGLPSMTADNRSGQIMISAPATVTRAGICIGGWDICSKKKAVEPNIIFSAAVSPSPSRTFFRSAQAVSMNALGTHITLMGFDVQGNLVVAQPVGITQTGVVTSTALIRHAEGGCVAHIN